jgi:hypothetical protein
MTQLINNIKCLTTLELRFEGGYLVKSPSSNGNLTERADGGRSYLKKADAWKRGERFSQKFYLKGATNPRILRTTGSWKNLNRNNA